jgi:hypothetical protein
MENVSPLMAPRACLLILGMHRSGTSAVCGVLHQLGAERPVREMPPQSDNEKGFFEPIEISAIHDRMLASAGLYWFDWEPMPRAWYEPFVVELVEAAKLDFPGRGTFLLKDPRVCRFVDVWREVLARLEVRPVVVVPYRHPIEVAQSLKVRDGFSIAHGLLMWLRHVVDAEKASRSMERSFTNFTNLLVDWEAELASVIVSSGTSLSKQSARAMAMAADHLDSALRHQVKRERLTQGLDHEWFFKTFDALELLRVDPYDQQAMATLDVVRDAFDVASAAFSPAFQQLLLQVDHLGRIAGRVAEVDAALVSTQQALAAVTPSAERLPSVEAELETTQQHLTAIQTVAERVPGLEAELNGTRQALAATQAAAERVPGLEAELDGIRQALAAAQPAADRVPGLEAELDGANQTLAILQPVADRVPDLEKELEHARQSLAAVQPVADRVPGLEAELARALSNIVELQQQLGVTTLKLSKTLSGRLAAGNYPPLAAERFR